jgi:hypothetical protein
VLIANIILIAKKYEKHPNFSEFNENPNRKILAPSEVGWNRMKSISDFYLTDYPSIQISKKYFKILFELVSIQNKASISGKIKFENDGYYFSEKANKTEREEIEKKLNSKLDELKKFKFNNSEVVLTNFSNKVADNIPLKTLFESQFIGRFDSLKKSELSKSNSLVLNVKSFFGLLSDEETKHIDDINNTLASLPIFLTNNVVICEKSDFLNDYTNELAILIFGRQNAFSHGFITNYDYAINQIKVLNDIEKKFFYKVPSSFKEKLNKNSLNKSILPKILAVIVYYSLLISLSIFILSAIYKKIKS